ncbi:peroxiredoxin family protein [Pullulanibacillus sp. KACC 23026]|uniref:peroxiredoxin family protein n=1 Tax=Pullulanibacillus sp. KACC 23026 TaxID=3028315 RepID=UPI0023B08340|nr:peroxiredoxin family protein [Pullulanibacillus sp. KACC 23026]WEG14385.1 peroxiredoxin family protein [Pullulanibacillus sp. KACC 23026]
MKEKGLRLGSQLPQFVLEGADGLVYRSEDWKGKPALLIFHRGTWCHSCRNHLEQIGQNMETFRQLGLAVYSILGQKKDPVIKFLEKNPLPFPVLIDESRDVIKAFDVYHPIGYDAFNIARPSIFLVSPEQTILYSYVGRHQADLLKNDKLTATVHELLSKVLVE